MKRIGLVLLAACGSSSSPKNPDAHVADAAPDTRPIDAAIDTAIDTALPDSGEPVPGHYHYVISRQVWPTSVNEARADAFDVDGNGQLDNELGQVMASLVTQGFDVQTPTDQALARGATITLADLGADDLTTSQAATFTLYQGSDASPAPCSSPADTTCGHHLQGNASFSVTASPRDTPLDGAIAAGQLTAGPGHLTVGLTVFGTSAITLLGARAKLTPTAGGIMTGILGGAISITDRDGKIYPAMASAFATQIAHDCTALQSPPQCGCTANSSGATLLMLLDANHDCVVTTMEIHDNSLMMNLFAPDVTVENQQAISIGFAFTAVDATFTP